MSLHADARSRPPVVKHGSPFVGRPPDGQERDPGIGSEPSAWTAVLVLTLIAVVTRVPALDSGLWWDELRTLIDSVRPPLYSIITVFPGDNQHTLYSVLARGCILLFGEHPWSLRLPAVLAGVAMVPLLYLVAREFTERLEAMLAALLLAVSYHHVWFSQSARGYTLLGLATLLSTWLLLRGLRRSGYSDFVWYAVVSALGAYTHLTMVFVVASHALLVLLALLTRDTAHDARRRLEPALMGFALAGLFTVLLYSPVALEVQRVVVKEPMRGATPRWALIELVRGLQVGLGSLVGVAVAGMLFLAGARSYLKQSPFLTGVMLLPGAVTLAANVVLQRPVRPRFFFFLCGFAVLLLVRGALEVGGWLSRRFANDTVARKGSVAYLGVGLVLVLALASAASLRTNYRYPKQDFEGPLRFVESQRGPGVTIGTAGGARYPYRAYYGRPYMSVDSLSQLQRVRAEGQRVWVIYTLQRYIQSQTPDLMRVLLDECAERRVFRGTVGDGDVTVCLLGPMGARS